MYVMKYIVRLPPPRQSAMKACGLVGTDGTAMTGRLKIKAQILLDEAIAIGPGKAELLAEIDRTGSIAGAGRSLGLSYRRTRDMVDTLNTCWNEPLVCTSRGGTAHGGARLTETGRAVLGAYRDLSQALDSAGAKHAVRLLAMLRQPETA
jgi:molybdate transport system regulatory protein